MVFASGPFSHSCYLLAMSAAARARILVLPDHGQSAAACQTRLAALELHLNDEAELIFIDPVGKPWS